MHKLKTIQETLDLLKQYDYQIAMTARKTGNNQRTIKRWFDKQRKGQPLLIENKKKPSKFTHSMKKQLLTTTLNMVKVPLRQQNTLDTRQEQP